MYFIIFTILLSIFQISSYTDNALLKALPLFFYSLLWYFYAYKYSKSNVNSTFFKNRILLIYIFILIIGLLRNNNPILSISFTVNRILSFVLLISGLVGVFKFYRINKGFDGRDLIVKFAIIPFILFALINFSLWILGVTIRESVITDNIVNNKAVLLSAIGINIDRVEFPLSGGFNNYAVLLGSLLTLCLLSYCKRYKFILRVGILISLVSLLLIDSRAAIIYPFFIFMLLKLNIESLKFKSILPYTVLLVILGPLLIYLITPLLANLSFFQSISRNSEDLATGNERFFIWTICLGFFSKFSIEHVFGYGDYGHYGSGASKIWAFIFSNWENSEMKSSHSTLFGLLFDYGYIGLFVYVMLLFKCFKTALKCWFFDKNLYLPVVGFFVYIILAGITETLNGFYFSNFLILFFIMLLILFTGNYKSSINNDQ